MGSYKKNGKHTSKRLGGINARPACRRYEDDSGTSRWPAIQNKDGHAGYTGGRAVVARFVIHQEAVIADKSVGRIMPVGWPMIETFYLVMVIAFACKTPLRASGFLLRSRAIPVASAPPAQVRLLVTKMLKTAAIIHIKPSEVVRV